MASEPRHSCRSTSTTIQEASKAEEPQLLSPGGACVFKNTSILPGALPGAGHHIPPPSNPGCLLLGPHKGFSAPCTAQATEAAPPRPPDAGGLATKQSLKPRYSSGSRLFAPHMEPNPRVTHTGCVAWDRLPTRSVKWAAASRPSPAPGSPLCRLQPGPVSHQGGASCVSSGDATLHC